MFLAYDNQRVQKYKDSEDKRKHNKNRTLLSRVVVVIWPSRGKGKSKIQMWLQIN
ncbi:unnamed protein product [Gulo gulo]|uniref:Uncharacterized protein n=1 Tax=Gulo gulo TaxID=48420 RepID=A0A9X9LY49_GULGU|nr:unnamed protein product [Gulo gulo]